MRSSYEKSDLGRSFGFVVCASLLVQVLLSVPYAYFGENIPDWAYWTIQAVYTCAIGLCAFVYSKIVQTDFVAATRLNKPPKFAHVAWGCGVNLFLMAAMLPVNTWTMDWIQSLGLNRPSVDLPMQWLPLVLVACVLPALTEEIVFRGTVAQSAKGFGKIGSVAITGALFALFHVNPAQTLHQFALGAFLALAALRSGSTWTAVCVHFFNNLVAVVLSFVTTEEALRPYFWYMLAAGVVGCALCLLGYLKTTQSCTDFADKTEENFCKEDLPNLVYLLGGIALMAVLWVTNLLS